MRNFSKNFTGNVKQIAWIVALSLPLAFLTVVDTTQAQTSQVLQTLKGKDFDTLEDLELEMEFIKGLLYSEYWNKIRLKLRKISSWEITPWEYINLRNPWLEVKDLEIIFILEKK
jgi:hypothetical protein